MPILIELEKLNNTRDLGGMKTADGREIKPGLLYRSGFLQRASEADIKKLSDLGLTAIIDFRADEESIEQPDPQIGTAVYIHLPAEDEELLGIERDKKSEKRFTEVLIDRVVEDPNYAIRYMSGMYRRFINNSFTIGQYKKFLKILDESTGPVLWHCTAGKDRAGFASILIEEILGVPREEIIADYLRTNEYIKEEAAFLVDMFSRMYAGDFPKEAVKVFFSAHPDFIGALYEQAEEKYGSFEGYLTQALGVDEALRSRLQEKYLC